MKKTEILKRDDFTTEESIRYLLEKCEYLLSKIPHYDKSLNEFNDIKPKFDSIFEDNRHSLNLVKETREVFESHEKDIGIISSNLNSLEVRTINGINDFFYSLKILSDDIIKNRDEAFQDIRKTNEKLNMVDIDKEEKIMIMAEKQSGAVSNFLDYFYKLEASIKENHQNMLKEKEDTQNSFQLKIDEVNKELSRIKNMIVRLSEEIKK